MARKLALIIGNSQYEDTGLARLAAPDVDVRALAEVLQTPGIGGFDEVTPLLNEGLATVRKAIARFFDLKHRDDLLVLYFSGHGVRDEQGHLYLAVRDTERAVLAGTAIEASYVTTRMDRSASKRLVLVLDCCHSGAFGVGAKSAQGATVGTASAFEGTGRGRVVLTATDSTQYAWEGDQVIGDVETSLFTHYLIEGLRTGAADRDEDGRVTIDELYDYVYEHVLNETPRQTPGKWAFGQQGDIVIASNPAATRVRLPVEVEEALASRLPSVRLEAVRELENILKGRHSARANAALEMLRKLTEDDSRRVASAADEILKGYDRDTAAGVDAEQERQREAARLEEEEHRREEAAARLRLEEEARRVQAEREQAERERAARAQAEREEAERVHAERSEPNASKPSASVLNASKPSMSRPCAPRRNAKRPSVSGPRARKLHANRRSASKGQRTLPPPWQPQAPPLVGAPWTMSMGCSSAYWSYRPTMRARCSFARRCRSESMNGRASRKPSSTSASCASASAVSSPGPTPPKTMRQQLRCSTTRSALTPSTRKSWSCSRLATGSAPRLRTTSGASAASPRCRSALRGISSVASSTTQREPSKTRPRSTHPPRHSHLSTNSSLH